MNEKEMQDKIKVSIKNEKLREYLLVCLKNECRLNALNLPAFLIENATHRFEKKIKNCQQIEIDLPDHLILPGDYFLLSEKLDILRLKLAMLHVDGKVNAIAEENYKEIKDFILKLLSFRGIQLKLKYFDLAIKLLEKALDDSHFNKEFIGAFDLLKLFVNEPNNHPNQQDLQYINYLRCQTNDDGIRKMFYGVIREVNKKLLFQDLLNQLLKIVKNRNNNPLVQFNIVFITKFLNDPETQAADFNQMIGLVFQSLKHYLEPVLMKKDLDGIRKIFNKNKLTDNLTEFKKDFIEKTSEKQIIHEPIKLDLSNASNILTNNPQELDISIYFPTYIKNQKIRAKFNESKKDFNKTLEKNIAKNYFSLKHIKSEFVRISKKANGIIDNVKVLASGTKENLEKFAENNADRLTRFIKKDSEISYPDVNEKIDKNDLKNLLLQAKDKLLPIQKKLEIWNSILTLNLEKDDNNLYNQITNIQFDLNQSLALLNSFTDTINEKFAKLIEQTLSEFKKINDAMQKNFWLAKSETAKVSLFHQIFHRGYFNGNYTIKKIKSRLGNCPAYTNINNFILERSFMGLLSYGIIRWPWINKALFARTWAEQLCLPQVITQTEELKNRLSDNDDELLRNIITLTQIFFPYKKSEIIIQILDNFKKYIAIQLRQLKAFEQEIDGRLTETENSSFKLNFKSKNNLFFEDKKDALSSGHDVNMNYSRISVC